MTDSDDLDLMHESLRQRGLHPLADGVLSSGQTWMSAIEPNASGGIGYVLVTLRGGGNHIGLNVHLGLRSYGLVGIPGFASFDDIRAYCWNTSPDVTAVEILHGPQESRVKHLATDPVLEAEDATLHVAMIDASVSLRAAKMLNSRREVLATMDLSQDQLDFQAQRDWLFRMSRDGLEQAGPPPFRTPRRPVT